MYYPIFIVYIIAGFTIALWAFLWALRNGQFKDQQRARFLPLDEDGEEPVITAGRMNRSRAFLLLGLSASGILALAAALVYLLVFGG